jgi:hypothetical protein
VCVWYSHIVERFFLEKNFPHFHCFLKMKINFIKKFNFSLPFIKLFDLLFVILFEKLKLEYFEYGIASIEI